MFLPNNYQHWSNLRRVIESRSMRGWVMWHAWGKGEVDTGFWRENLREGDHLEGLDLDGG